MRQHERERVMAELASLIGAGETPMAPVTMLNPVDRYVDPDHTRRELDTVFAGQPRVIAVSAQLPNPGDFVTDELTGEPLVVMRGDDGTVRAFYNVCVHRGTQVVCEAQGNRRRYACPFHGWVFGNDGTLVSIPNPDSFGELGDERRRLSPIPVVERHGLVWRLPDGWSEADLVASLGGLDDELASYGVQRCVLERSVVLEQPINWKFVIDGFLETYHFRFLHKNSIAPFFRADFGPTVQYGRNIRMVAVRASYERHVLQADAPVDPMPHIAGVYVLFPNTVFVWQGTHHEVWTVHPKAGRPDRCLVRVSVLIPDPATASAPQPDWERNWKVLIGTVEHEDFLVSRRAQAGMATAAQTHLIYGRNEPALQAFHRGLAELVP